MTVVRHAHSSSLHSGTPASLADQVDRASSADDPSCNLMSFTEVDDAQRADALHADGWGAYAPHTETDCALMWAKDRWALVDKGTHRLTPKTWVVSGHTHKLVAARIVLDATDDSGRIWLMAAHFPSGVQGKGGFSDEHPDRVAAWRDGLKGLDQWKADQNERWHPDWMGLCADWNLDMKLGWCRDTIKDRFSQLHCTWQSPYPNGGTHGDRLIDAVWCGGTTTKCELLKDDHSSDHRPWWHITDLAD